MFYSLYDNIKNKRESISIIGLGYVGLPLAISFSKKANVIGFDINNRRVDLYKKGIDVTKEVGDEELRETTATITCDENKLKSAKFHIITVPTPIKDDKMPDLKYIIAATKTLGKNLVKGSVVVYESTVYPGVTEEICVPILEQESGLKCGTDFKVGYSPERINPGDKKHRLENIVKVVSGIDEVALNIIANVYELIIEAGVYRVQSIKIAEAAKVIENCQRDINIAFINELSIIFNKMGIDTKSVLEASKTKWNFLEFYPGLVGGHCIGIDPYYLTYKAEQIGYHSQVILSGRRINDDMGRYIAQYTVKKLIKADKQVKNAKVAILGITFKEDCPDVRNSKVIDIIDELNEYGIDVLVSDPIADEYEVMKEYGIELVNFSDINNIDAVIIAVAHKEYFELNLKKLKELYNSKTKSVLIDVKGIFDRKEAELSDYLYWRL